MSETSKRPSYRDQVVIEAAVDKIIADVAIKEDTAELIVQPIDEDCTRFGATGGWVHPFEDARLP